MLNIQSAYNVVTVDGRELFITQKYKTAKQTPFYLTCLKLRCLNLVKFYDIQNGIERDGNGPMPKGWAERI